MGLKRKLVLITGPPGIGKTTLVKAICSALKDIDKRTDGFYTEELRSDNVRTGFDVVTLDGKRARLARTQNVLKESEFSKFKLGQYVVFTQDFEQLVLPLFKTEKDYFVIDEIGKMELFSVDFKQEIENVFKNSNVSIIATIPGQKGRPIPLVESIRNHSSAKLYTVDRSNRNNLKNEVISYLTT